MKVHVFNNRLNGEAEVQLSDFHNRVKEVPFFQSVGFFNATIGTENYRPVFFTVTDTGNNIIGSMLAHHIRVLPFRCRYTSFTLIVGGPVLENIKEKNEVLDLLLAELKRQYSGKSLFIEFRNLKDQGNYNDIFKKNGFDFKNWLNSEVDVSDVNAMLGNIGKNKQKQIAEAEGRGFITRPAKNEKEIEIFYRQLKHFYLFELHRPLPPKEVFLSLYFQASKNGSTVPLIICILNEKIMGGMVCPYDSDKMYEWYVCSVNQRKGDPLSGVAITYGGLIYAGKRGIQYFNFMGLGKPEKEYGVRRFKRQFGGNENNYGRYILKTSGLLSEILYP